MSTKSKRILVADDDPVYSEVAREALEAAGHAVTTAAHGGEALALLARQTFDAAIIDLTMPVADGLTVIRTLRASERNAGIPVVVITGHDDAAAVERAYRAGATSFLTKPLNWVLFPPHIEFVLRSGQIEADLREANATAAFVSELKSQMMNALAGEFQGPIKTIFGFSELIAKEVHGPLSPEPYREMVGDISRSARALNASLLKLMDFGRSLSEKITINSDTVDLQDALADASAALRDEAENRQVTINAHINVPAGLTLTADRVLLNQTLRSVLDNAIRVSPRGGAVTLSASVAPEGDIVITSFDRGPAMPAMLLAEVNGSRRTTPRPLPEHRDVSIRIANVLLEAHQGRMDIKSDANRGNVVTIHLPKARVIADTSVAAAAPQATPAPVLNGPASEPAGAASPAALNEKLASISAALAQDPRVAALRRVSQAAAPDRSEQPLAARLSRFGRNAQ